MVLFLCPDSGLGRSIRGREAAAYVQGETLKAVAPYLVAVSNSRLAPPEAGPHAPWKAQNEEPNHDQDRPFGSPIRDLERLRQSRAGAFPVTGRNRGRD